MAKAIKHIIHKTIIKLKNLSFIFHLLFRAAVVVVYLFAKNKKDRQ